jgi:hypothetical protein
MNLKKLTISLVSVELTVNKSGRPNANLKLSYKCHLKGHFEMSVYLTKPIAQFITQSRFKRLTH